MHEAGNSARKRDGSRIDEAPYSVRSWQYVRYKDCMARVIPT